MKTTWPGFRKKRAKNGISDKDYAETNDKQTVGHKNRVLDNVTDNNTDIFTLRKAIYILIHEPVSHDVSKSVATTTPSLGTTSPPISP